MGRVSDLMLSIQEELETGRLSFEKIASMFNVPVHWVHEAALQMGEIEIDPVVGKQQALDNSAILLYNGYID